MNAEKIWKCLKCGYVMDMNEGDGNMKCPKCSEYMKILTLKPVRCFNYSHPANTEGLPSYTCNGCQNHSPIRSVPVLTPFVFPDGTINCWNFEGELKWKPVSDDGLKAFQEVKERYLRSNPMSKKEIYDYEMAILELYYRGMIEPFITRQCAFCGRTHDEWKLSADLNNKGKEHPRSPTIYTCLHCNPE